MRDLATQSKALLTHLVWRFYTKPEAHWATILSQKYLQHTTFRDRAPTATDSNLWRKMLHIRLYILDNLFWSVGDGTRIDAFRDRWIPGQGNGPPDPGRPNPHPPFPVSSLIIQDQQQMPRWNTNALRMWWDEDTVENTLTIPGKTRMQGPAQAKPCTSTDGSFYPQTTPPASEESSVTTLDP